jgi:hypothetical protein
MYISLNEKAKSYSVIPFGIKKNEMREQYTE